MGSLFKPWRRKIGVVTLVVACAFMAGWVRSRLVADSIAFSTKHYPAILISSRLGMFELSWFDENNFPLKLTPRWSVTPIVPDPSETGPTSLCSWGTAPMHSGGREIARGTSFTMQFRVIVTPLALLSAWLLLSKPRIAKPNAIDKR